MLTKAKQLQCLLSEKKELQRFLFVRGFLITTKALSNLDTFPFYGNWKSVTYGQFHLLHHFQTGFHVFEQEKRTFFIMGHAYNPFTMEHEEEKILAKIAKGYDHGNYLDDVNELTGNFILGVCQQDHLRFLVDTAGIQSACCGIVNEQFYLSSHAQLVGDICDLSMDAFVEELVAYKWYGRVKGPYLPADLTPFQEMKRVVPSMDYTYDAHGIVHKRFWLKESILMATDDKAYQKVIDQAADIMQNNMTLISRKWKHPAISLTGGIDSNTTFAAANGHYEQYETFSYISAEKEIIDAKAAQTIADHFHVKHTIFEIPQDANDIVDYDEKKAILMHNNGYVADTPLNEIRKRIFLQEHCKIDVEVKSWVSEAIRANWYKHFKRNTMPGLSAKLFRNLYKIFLCNRNLARKVDQIFKDYLLAYEYDAISSDYPIVNVNHIEMVLGSWGSLNMSEMKYCFDITIPYNNRKLLQTLFQVPLQNRIADNHHLDMKKQLNPALYDLNIRVVNANATAFRSKMLNAIFTVNSYLPF